jgi:serine/threonine protein kinase
MEDKLVEFRGNPKIGRKMLKYRILAEIGHGGMSVVYKARDERLERDVALKVLHAFLSKNADCRARLSREAKIAAQLQHPNILQVFDYSGEDENSEDAEELFIVTELVDGTTLKEFANNYSLHQIPELGALIVWEIALALQHAHALGVIHRDIKPENIMVRKDGVLKLMDFGIAQVKNLSSLTVTGTLLGSPAHMAPELIEGKPADHRADVFSLSTVLYWLLTGQMPFVSESPHALFKSIVDGRFAPPQQLSAKISNSLNQIILRGMSRIPEKRFASAKDMAAAISDALFESGIKPDEHELKSILTNPETQIPIFRKQIKNAYLSEIIKRKSNNETALVLSLLDRLIAEDPEDPQVLELLAEYEPKKISRLGTIGLAAIFVTVFLSLAALLTHWFESQRSLQANLKSEKNQTDFPGLPTISPKISTPKPSAVKAASEPDLENGQSELQTVIVNIDPYADFYVNGKLIEENTSKSKLRLKPGTYIFLFKHQFAAAEEISFSVNKKDKQQQLFISLTKTKPAALIINSEIDADIAVNGVYKGTTAASVSRPIRIALPDKTYAFNSDVIISKPGYGTLVFNIRFIAGQIKSLRIMLQPVDKKNVLKQSGN